MADRATDESPLQPMLEHALDQFAGCTRRKRQVNFRVPGDIVCENGRQAKRRGGFQGTNGQRPLGQAIVSHGPAGIFDQVRDLYRMGQQPLAGGSQGDPAAVPVEERRSEFLLEKTDASADIRLDGIQFRRGAVHPTQSGDSFKNPKIRRVHRPLLLEISSIQIKT